MSGSNLSFISKPGSALSGTIDLPGDKSITHRALIFAAIAEGQTRIQGYLKSDDCLATINALRSLGIVIEESDPQSLIVHGLGKYGLQKPRMAIDCGNSGTTMRLLAGLLSAQTFDSELTGDASLLKRPMERIHLPLQQMGARIRTLEGKAPLTIRGTEGLRGIHYAMPLVSAQVKSCILLAGLYAKGSTAISESGTSRDHSERMLATFSYPCERSRHSIRVNAEATLKPADIRIPGDISSAAFFIVAAAITPQSFIYIRQVGINPSRNAIITMLQRMGANIEILNSRMLGQEPVADIQVKYSPLKGIAIPASLVSIAIDEFPALCIAASAAKGVTLFRNARELRVKESDRIEAMARGLKTLGIKTETFEDGLSIEGGEIQGGKINSFGDHRIAMAFAIAGNIAKTPLTIDDVLPVNTSFPNFAETAQTLGMALEITDEN